MIRKIAEYVSLFVILSIPCIALFFIMSNAEWILGDNFVFISTTAAGHAIPLNNIATVSQGRFSPLSLQDFNLLLLIPHGRTAFAHYCLVAISFLAGYVMFLMSCVSSFREKTREYAYIPLTALAAALFAISPGFADIYSNLIFPERQLIVCLAIFILAFHKAVRSGSTKMYFLAVAAAIVSAYIKETASPALFSFSFLSLLFCRKRMSNSEKVAHYAIMANFVIFMVMWGIFGWSGTDNVYRTDARMTFSQLVYTVFSTNKALFLICLAAVIRWISIMLSKSEAEKFYDPLIAASFVFVAEYLVLNFNSAYYYVPAVLLGIIPMLRLSVNIIQSLFARNCGMRRVFSVVMMFVFVAIPLVQIPGTIRAAMLVSVEKTKIMPALRMMASHYAAGGNIYWFQPWGNYDRLYNLTELYVGFVLINEMNTDKDESRPLLVKTEKVPELNEKDIFIYDVLNRGQLNADSFTIAELQRQDFDLCQFQTGYLVFTHGQCALP